MRISSLTLRSKSPLSAQFIVTCRISSSDNLKGKKKKNEKVERVFPPKRIVTEALGVKLSPDRAYPGFPGLALLKPHV